MTDPRNIQFMSESRAGRMVHWIKEQADTPPGTPKRQPKILWTGSSSKSSKEKLDLAWQIICEQAQQLDELRERLTRLEDPNLVLLEPIEDTEPL